MSSNSEIAGNKGEYHGIRADEVIFEDVYTEKRDGASADLKQCKDAAQQGGKKRLAGQGNLGAINNDCIDMASAFQLFSGLSMEAGDGSGETRWNSDTGRVGLQRQVATASADSLQERLLRIKSELQDVVADSAALNVAGSSPEGGSASAWAVLENEARRLAAVADCVQLGARDEPKVAVDPRACGAEGSSGGARTAQRERVGVRVGESTVHLEQRLAVLESCVGCTSSTSIKSNCKSPDASLLASLEQLEQRVAAMDERALDAVKVKVAAVKKELDAFQQSSTTGIAVKGAVAGGAASPLKVVEAACIIDELYNRSLRVDEVVDALPSIVVRLRSLQSLHAQAAEYSHRMQALEDLVAVLSADAAANREVIEMLQSGVKANADVFGENVRQVQTRIDRLG